MKNRNDELEKGNRNLHSFIKYLFDRIKEFFRNILLKGNERSKDLTFQRVKDYYDYGDFQQEGLIDIAKATTREEELSDYAYVPGYHRTISKDKYDNFDLSIWK